MDQNLDLVFRPDDREPLELVFGDDAGAGESPAYTLSGGGQITGLRGATGSLTYDYNVPRPALAWRRSVAEVAQPISAAVRSGFQDAAQLTTATRIRAEVAQPIGAATRIEFQRATPLSSTTRSVVEVAKPIGTSVRSAFQRANGLSAALRSRMQTGQLVQTGLRGAFEQALKLQLHQRSGFEVAHTVVVVSHQTLSIGVPMVGAWRLPFEQGRQPYPGASRPPPPDPRDGWCYLPEEPIALLFKPDSRAPLELLFECERHPGPVDPEPGTSIVIPVRSVYMTINSFSLKRLDNDYPIMATAMSLSLDVDSWTWTCSFSVNGSALPTVARNSNGDLVVARATINGTPIDFLLEQISRDRSFGSSQLRVQGRGLSAQLDDPYAPVLTFGNPSSARTARQLLDDILTINGVSNGWGISAFDPTDWYVPAGVFAHQGSYISAMNQVVGSVGAYLQPQDTGQNMDVRMRYPTPSWEWSGATPDIVLPSAVTSQEGIDWVNKPDYNRVFVVGQENGVLGRYTREGTDGAILAPGVVDPLITHVDAVRQRGRTILSQTGTMATVTLRLPVLAETGIIRPGKMVRYTDDGVTRIGMTRSVGVDVAMPTIYQTIEVETYV